MNAERQGTGTRLTSFNRKWDVFPANSLSSPGCCRKGVTETARCQVPQWPLGMNLQISFSVKCSFVRNS